MAPPRRVAQKAQLETLSPPAHLTNNQAIARVERSEGNYRFTCTLPNGRCVLVELDQKFRNLVWLRRGGFVLLELIEEECDSATAKGKAKRRVQGYIENVVQDQSEWRSQAWW